MTESSFGVIFSGDPDPAIHFLLKSVKGCPVSKWRPARGRSPAFYERIFFVKNTQSSVSFLVIAIMLTLLWWLFSNYLTFSCTLIKLYFYFPFLMSPNICQCSSASIVGTVKQCHIRAPDKNLGIEKKTFGRERKIIFCLLLTKYKLSFSFLSVYYLL